MNATKSAFAIIEKWEQFRAKAYLDSAGIWTIGYGHTRTVTATTPDIDICHAILLLKEDVHIVETYINQTLPDLRQCQFNALTSLLFNVGFDNFAKTKTSNLIKKNRDDKYIAGEWIEFRNAGGKYLRGLMRRRIDELSLYYSW